MSPRSLEDPYYLAKWVKCNPANAPLFARHTPRPRGHHVACYGNQPSPMWPPTTPLSPWSNMPTYYSLYACWRHNSLSKLCFTMRKVIKMMGHPWYLTTMQHSMWQWTRWQKAQLKWLSGPQWFQKPFKAWVCYVQGKWIITQLCLCLWE